MVKFLRRVLVVPLSVLEVCSKPDHRIHLTTPGFSLSFEWKENDQDVEAPCMRSMTQWGSAPAAPSRATQYINFGQLGSSGAMLFVFGVVVLVNIRDNGEVSITLFQEHWESSWSAVSSESSTL